MHAALAHEATGVGRGAGYTALDGTPPAESEHFAVAAAYAHATAPLRRLQDRYVSECCLAACAGAVVIDDELVQLRDPAVRGRLEGDGPEPGSEVTVRLDRADPATRSVAFSVARSRSRAAGAH